jgi:hypothetical protein
MSFMGKVEIRIPLVSWRNGRPRFIPGPTTRELGYKGEDLRHADGSWLSLDETIAWASKRQAEIADRRRDVDAGETTKRKTRNALARARAEGLVTVGQLCTEFVDSPRMSGKTIVQGRKKRDPLADNTIRYYKGAARLLEAFDKGRVWTEVAAAVTPKALSGILDRIEIAHGLAQARAVRAFLSVAYGHGMTHRLVPANPVATLKETLPELAPRLRPATIDEIETLVAVADAIGAHDVGDMIVAGVWTGQRQNDRLAVPAKYVSAEGIYFEPSKKKRTAQRLLIPVSNALANRLELAEERRKDWKVTPITLFACDATARPWGMDWYRKAFRMVRHVAAFGDAERDRDGRLTKDASAMFGAKDVPALLAAAGIAPMVSLADLRDQDLRDTCLSWLPLAGCDKFEIAGFSGHAFAQSEKVMRHYVAIPPEFARRGMEKLEAWHAAQLAGRKAVRA